MDILNEKMITLALSCATAAGDTHGGSAVGTAAAARRPPLTNVNGTPTPLFDLASAKLIRQ